jgi:HPt (histidine-containing phosphotransfer) domain-containing protein
MDGTCNHPEMLDAIYIVESQRNHNLSQVIARMYIASAPVLLQAMRDAAAEGNLRELARAADALKSSTANLGAHRLAECCRELCELPSKEALASVPERLEKIAGAVTVICTALADKGGKLAPPVS